MVLRLQESLHSSFGILARLLPGRAAMLLAVSVVDILVDCLKPDRRILYVAALIAIVAIRGLVGQEVGESRSAAGARAR